MALENTYNTTEENLLAGILIGIGGTIANVGNDQINTKNDLLLAIKNQLEINANGGGAVGLVLTSQFGTKFSLAVDEETDENGIPTGTGAITITKI